VERDRADRGQDLEVRELPVGEVDRGVGVGVPERRA